MDSWNTKHFSTISGLAGLHYLAISFPMPMAEALRNNEVERLAKRLTLCVAEHALGCRVPYNDGAVGACRDNRISRYQYELLRVKWSTHHDVLPMYGRYRFLLPNSS
jgi:hypothetical protein